MLSEHLNYMYMLTIAVYQVELAVWKKELND